MAKTKYQQAGIDYAKDYLDKLLEMEDYVGRKSERTARHKAKEPAKDSEADEQPPAER